MPTRETKPFTCVICEREIEMLWDGRGPLRSLPPVCRGCEQHWGPGSPQAGAFRDRRKAIQIGALAEALRSCAALQKYESRYARS